MKSSILGQAVTEWQNLTAKGYDPYQQIGGESPFRLDALGALYGWIRQVQSSDTPAASSLSSKATTFCLLELTQHAEEHPEFKPIAIAAMMMAMTRKDTINERDSDLFDDAFNRVVQRIIYDGTTLEDCLELRFFITSVLDMRLATRHPTCIVKIMMDAFALFHLGQIRGWRGPVLSRPNIKARYLKKLDLVQGKPRRFETWRDLIGHLFSKISNHRYDNTLLPDQLVDQKDSQTSANPSHQENSQNTSKKLTILSQALAAWKELEDIDHDPPKLVGNEVQCQFAALHDIHDWIMKAESSSRFVSPVFSADTEFTDDALSSYLYTFGEKAMLDTRFTPITSATLMMVLVQDQPMDDWAVENLDLSSLRAMRAILAHGDLEDILELYFFVSLILESYSGDTLLIKALLVVLETAIIQHLICSRNAIGPYSSPSLFREECINKMKAACQYSNNDEEWLDLVDVSFSNSDCKKHL